MFTHAINLHRLLATTAAPMKQLAAFQGLRTMGYVVCLTIRQLCSTFQDYNLLKHKTGGRCVSTREKSVSACKEMQQS